MNNLISCCGLNCETCEARIATLNNDNQLRQETAEKWQKMYNAKHITAETINCLGCRQDGVKFAHCSKCEIRLCVQSKGYQTCGDCSEVENCQIVSFVHKHVPDALENLKRISS